MNESERTSEGAADLEVPAAAKRNRASCVAYSQVWTERLISNPISSNFYLLSCLSYLL